MQTLEGKTVLITGANGGLGRAVTQAFLDSGAKVGGAAQAIQDSDFSSANFMALSGEVSTAEAAAAVAQKVKARWGRIDGLIHLIGGFAGGTRVEDTSDETLDKMLAMNLCAAFHFIKAVVPGMRAQGSGRIIAIGSRTAVIPTATLGVYSASKAAVVSLVRREAGRSRIFFWQSRRATSAHIASPRIAKSCAC